MTHSIEMRCFCARPQIEARPQMEIQLKIPVGVIFSPSFEIFCKIKIVNVFQMYCESFGSKFEPKWCNFGNPNFESHFLYFILFNYHKVQIGKLRLKLSDFRNLINHHNKWANVYMTIYPNSVLTHAQCRRVSF